ncbi:MAG: archaetidylserine decarboxylase [Nevskiales bacterium]|nr:archaetidylserine decarboxylase [Nevskiales bacterium]
MSLLSLKSRHWAVLQRTLDTGFALLQWLLPTHFLSLLILRATQITHEPVKNFLIGAFVKIYSVNLAEAEFSSVSDYPDFNTFFTRALKPQARPTDRDPAALISPVDGRISQAGLITDGTLIQAKGRTYSVAELLGSPQMAGLFRKGHFCTLYLAPRNYHRVHMPADGRLREWGYQPGRLFSVNARSTRRIPRLFARNERLYATFDTDYGPFAIVLVGALLVGGIETSWLGPVTPPHGQNAGIYRPVSPVALARGSELGRFNMGSTVILLTTAETVLWRTLMPGRDVRLGQALGTWTALTTLHAER